MDGTEVSLHVNFNVFDAKKYLGALYLPSGQKNMDKKKESISVLHNYVPNLSNSNPIIK